jgi:hypothetical protein
MIVNGWPCLAREAWYWNRTGQKQAKRKVVETGSSYQIENVPE